MLFPALKCNLQVKKMAAKKLSKSEAQKMINFCEKLLPVASEGRELNEDQILMLRKKVFDFGSEELKDKFMDFYGDDEDDLSFASKRSGAKNSNKNPESIGIDGDSISNLTFEQQLTKAAVTEIIKGVMKIAGDLLKQCVAPQNSD